MKIFFCSDQLRRFQFVLIGLSAHLSDVAGAMLESLRALAKDSIIIFDDSLVIDYDALSRKNTLLFVSSEYMATMKNKLEHIGEIFMLDSDHSKPGYRDSFPTGEDLIFQLADELYRCYKLEASDLLDSGDTDSAKQKEELADRIHDELKKAYTSTVKEDNSDAISADTTTVIVWLKSKMEDDAEVKKAQDLLDGIAPPFELLHSEIAWQNYLQNTKSCGTLFLITDSDEVNLIPTDLHSSFNVQAVYRYGKTSSINDDDDDLCFELLTDLAIHYNKLGTIHSARENPKTAKDMFMKVSKLYEILAKF